MAVTAAGEVVVSCYDEDTRVPVCVAYRAADGAFVREFPAVGSVAVGARGEVVQAGGCRVRIFE